MIHFPLFVAKGAVIPSRDILRWVCLDCGEGFNFGMHTPIRIAEHLLSPRFCPICGTENLLAPKRQSVRPRRRNWLWRWFG
jgi:hypothetical protein